MRSFHFDIKLYDSSILASAQACTITSQTFFIETKNSSTLYIATQSNYPHITSSQRAHLSINIYIHL